MDPVKYEARRIFIDKIKAMGKNEHIEIARILRDAKVPISENRSGVFFDLAKVDDAIFEKLQQFHAFITQNAVALDVRPA